MEFLKKIGKQWLIAIVVAIIIFLVWPGATTIFFIGMAVGLIAGNISEPIEAAIEKLISKF